MKVIDKVGLGAIFVIVITNPASSQFILALLDEIFKEIFIYASPINFAASGIVVAYIVYKMISGRERVKTAPKAKKQPKVAYIET